MVFDRCGARARATAKVRPKHRDNREERERQQAAFTSYYYSFVSIAWVFSMNMLLPPLILVVVVAMLMMSESENDDKIVDYRKKTTICKQRYGFGDVD